MADIEITTDVSEIEAMNRALAALNRSLAATRDSMFDMETAGEGASDAYRELQGTYNSLMRRQSFYVRTIADSRNAVLALNAAQQANMATMANTVAAQADAARGLTDYASRQQRMLDLQQEIRATQREVTQAERDLAAARREAANGSEMGVTAAQNLWKALQTTENNLQSLRAEYAELSAAETRWRIDSVAATVSVGNAMTRLAGVGDDLRDSMLGVGAAFNKVDQEASRMTFMERQNQIAAATIRVKKEIADLTRQIDRLDESDPNIIVAMGDLGRKKAELAALTSEAQKLSVVQQELARNIQLRRAADAEAAAAEKAAAREAAARAKAQSAAEKELYDARMRGNAALIKSRDAQTAAGEAARNATRAKEILAEAEAKFGAESRAAIAAQKQYDRTLGDLNEALHAQARAETAAAMAMEDRMALMLRTTLTMEQQQAVIDRADEAYNRLNTTLGQTDKRYEELRQSASGAGHQIEKSAVHEVGRGGFRTTVTDFSRDSSLYTRGLGQLNAEFGKLLTTIAIAKAQIMSVVAAFGLVSFTDQVRQLDSMNNALKATFTTTTQLAQATTELDQIAAVYGERSKDTYRSYILLTSAAQAQAISLREINAAFEGVTAASVVLGQSQEDVKASLLALSQIAAKGVLSMEELRQQLGERLPTALALTAKGMKMTTSELIAEITRGNVSAHEFFAVFGDQMMQTYGTAAAAMNSLSKAFGQAGEAFDDFLQVVMTQGARDALMTLAQSFEQLMRSDAMAAFADQLATTFSIVSSVISGIMSLAENLYLLNAALAITVGWLATFAAKMALIGLVSAVKFIAGLKNMTGALAALTAGLRAAWAALVALDSAALAAMFTNPVIAAITVVTAAVAGLAYYLSQDLPQAANVGAQEIADSQRKIQEAVNATQQVLMAAQNYRSSPSAANEQAYSQAKEAADKAMAEVQASIETLSNESERARAEFYAAQAELLDLQARAATGGTRGERAMAAYALAQQKAEIEALTQEILALEAAKQKLVSADSRATNILAPATAINALNFELADLNKTLGATGAAAYFAATSLDEAIGKAAAKVGVDSKYLRTVFQDLVVIMQNSGTALQGTAAEWQVFIDTLAKTGSLTEAARALQDYFDGTEQAMQGIVGSLQDANAQTLDWANSTLKIYETTVKQQEAGAKAAEFLTEAAEATGLSAAQSDALSAALDKSAQAAYDLVFNVGNVRANMDPAQNAALNLMRAMYDAATGADAAADGAAALRDRLKESLGVANALRAALGAGMVNVKEMADLGRSLVAERAALLIGGQEGLDAQKAIVEGREREAAVIAATSGYRDQIAQADAEMAKMAENRAQWGVEELRVYTDLAKTKSGLVALEATGAAQARKNYDIATENAKLQAQIEESVKDSGGGGGKTPEAAAEAKTLTESLKLLKAATADARGETEQQNAEAARLAEAMAQVDAAVKAGTLSINGLGIDMGLVQQRIMQLLYGVRDLGDVLRDSFTQGLTSIGDAISDLFTGGLEEAQDFADKMEDIFRSMMKTLLNTVIQNKIIVPIQMGLNGQAGGGLLGSLSGSFFKGMDSVFQGFSSGGFTGAISAVGQGLSGVTSGLSGLAGALGAVTPVLGAVGLVAAAFKETKTVKFDGLRLSVSEFGLEVDRMTKVTKSKLFGLLKSNKTTLAAAGEAGDAIAAEFASMIEAVQKSATTLGMAAGGFTDFSKIMGQIADLDLRGLSDEEKASRITAALEGMASHLVAIGTTAAGTAEALAAAQREGESLYDTLLALAASMESVNDTLASMQIAELPQSVAGGDAARQLTDLFGGVNEFLSASNSYANAFLTDAEQIYQQRLLLQRQADRLNATYADANVVVPKTATQLRAMVKALDLTTEAGRASYAFLVGNADAFADLFDKLGTGLKDLSESIDDLLSRRSDIMDELVSRYDALIAAEKNLADVRKGLLTSDLAPGTEISQLAALRQQFDEAVRKGIGGDAAAATEAGQLAQQLLQQGRTVYASSTQYADLFRQVNEALGKAQAGVRQSAGDLKPQLDAETFRDVSRQSTAALLRALAQIEARLTELRDQQGDAADKAAKNAQRRNTGTGG